MAIIFNELILYPLDDNFLIDTDIYLIILQFEKLEVTRKEVY